MTSVPLSWRNSKAVHVRTIEQFEYDDDSQPNSFFLVLLLLLESLLYLALRRCFIRLRLNVQITSCVFVFEPALFESFTKRQNCYSYQRFNTSFNITRTVWVSWKVTCSCKSNKERSKVERISLFGLWFTVIRGIRLCLVARSWWQDSLLARYTQQNESQGICFWWN